MPVPVPISVPISVPIPQPVSGPVSVPSLATPAPVSVPVFVVSVSVSVSIVSPVSVSPPSLLLQPRVVAVSFSIVPKVGGGGGPVVGGIAWRREAEVRRVVVARGIVVRVV